MDYLPHSPSILILPSVEKQKTSGIYEVSSGSYIAQRDWIYVIGLKIWYKVVRKSILLGGNDCL